jgi:PAT family beta-lactamase induction signal transducer AmpG
MALGMMLPGMASGFIQAHFGYLNFFVWICALALATLGAVHWVRIPADFGRRTAPVSEKESRA